MTNQPAAPNTCELQVLEGSARAGDLEAFGSLIRLLDSDLRGVAWAIVRDKTKTDDVLQDTYEKAAKALADFNGNSSLKTWLHSICYRTAIDHSRRQTIRSHEPLDLDSTGFAGQAALPSIAGGVVSKVWLQQGMAQLDPESRALTMMVIAYGYSYDEAAKITGLARGTISSRLSRAKSTLRAYFEESENR